MSSNIIKAGLISVICTVVSSKRNSTCDFVGLANPKLKCEVHETYTADGYRLEIYRIKGHKITKKKPVLLAHGLFGSSDIFVLTGWQHGIAFNLLREGYDVWLVNFRGNRYSLGHESYEVHKKFYIKNHKKMTSDYWKFSFWEMGVYDLPALIDKILLETKSKQPRWGVIQCMISTP